VIACRVLSAPSSGEGIYYAMVGGVLRPLLASAYLATGRARDLQLARKLFHARA